MKDVISFIVKNTNWNLLRTGRLKGDLMHAGKVYSVLTFEYRKDKHQFVLGAFGGKNGIRLFNILKENLKHSEIYFKSETKSAESLRITRKYISKNTRGKIGEVFFDEKYIYIYVNENMWKRIKFSKW